MNKRQKALNDLKQVKATLAHSGLYLTQDEEELLLRISLGEISDEEFKQKVEEMCNED